MDPTKIVAYVTQITAYTHGATPSKSRVTLSYESANTLGSIDVDFPTEATRGLYIGQNVRITFEPLADGVTA